MNNNQLIENCEKNLENLLKISMPSKTILDPLIPENNKTVGCYRTILYNGSKFVGHQKSKGSSYDVEVILQVRKVNGFRLMIKFSNQAC